MWSVIIVELEIRVAHKWVSKTVHCYIDDLDAFSEQFETSAHLQF